MREFTLVITEAHLNKAIAENFNKSSSGKEWNQKCILAQAAMELFPDFISCGYTSITTRTTRYTTKEESHGSNSTLYTLVRDFDKSVSARDYSTVRSKLPLAIEFKFDIPINKAS